MAETLSLMEFLQALLTDAELRSSFAHDPQETLALHGLADLTPDDVHDALVLVQDNQTVDYSLDLPGTDLSGTTAPPPPPPAGDGHEAAVEYLARYLAGPQQQAATDEPWPGLDPDAAGPAPTGAPVDEPDAPSGAGFDDDYGAGTIGAGDDHADVAYLAEPIDLTGHGADAPHPAGNGMAPEAGYDDLDDLDDLGDDTATHHGAPDPDPGIDPA